MAEESKNRIKFELVIPTSIAISDEVDMVLIPGVEGDLGILEGHTPVLTSIRPGLISLFVDGETTKSFFVEGGFAEITAKRCTILAGDVTDVAEISISHAESRLTKALEENDKINGITGSKEVQIARALVEVAENNNIPQ